MQPQHLLQQQPYGGSAVHAVTTPRVKALQQVWAKAYMGRMGKAHGFWRDACTV